MRTVKLKIGKDLRKPNSIGKTVQSVGTITPYCRFGGRQHAVNLRVLAGQNPLINFHKDLDDLRLSYQTYFKIIEWLDESYSEEVQKQN